MISLHDGQSTISQQNYSTREFNGNFSQWFLLFKGMNYYQEFGVFELTKRQVQNPNHPCSSDTQTHVSKEVHVFVFLRKENNLVSRYLIFHTFDQIAKPIAPLNLVSLAKDRVISP